MIIRNATILTMNDAREVITGDVWIRDGRIAAVGRLPDGAHDPQIVDAGGAIVLPGFVQTHVHLCQTIFRGLADGLPLLEWLRTRVWPLEAAHDDGTLRAAARLAAAELLVGGTTTVLTMETVHGTDAVFDALGPTGLRAVVGKCLMDRREHGATRLHQETQAGLDEAVGLHRRWHGAANGRLQAALAPRFALSCTRELLEAAGALSAESGMLVHTHASEQREEVALVRAMTGRDNLAYFADVGMATERLCAAHCVWTSDAERAILAERGVKVLHCPGSNLALGSGIAPVPEMRALGVSVSIGADGAACNNTLDMFHEMRLAVTLQAMRLGPGTLTAADAVWMATREGARALGLDRDVGSLEPGKKADLIVVGTGALHQRPTADPYSLLVFASRPSDVRLTVVDGQVVARDGEPTWDARDAVAADADAACRTLRSRAGL
jgi:5-methylthioadenosine/S-adenosylhomocysteine deaminase